MVRPAVVAISVVIALLVGLFGGLSMTQTKITTTTVTEVTTIVKAEKLTITITHAALVEELCFSKTERCDEIIIQLIDSAKKSVYVMIFSFTSNPIADALIRAHKRGVDVKVVLEEGQADVRGSEYKRLIDNGITVVLDKNEALMHHKVAIIDGYIVITGSYNWSRAAEDRNDENLIVIRSEEIAAEYLKEFERVFEQAIRG